MVNKTPGGLALHFMWRYEPLVAGLIPATDIIYLDSFSLKCLLNVGLVATQIMPTMDIAVMVNQAP